MPTSPLAQNNINTNSSNNSSNSIHSINKTRLRLRLLVLPLVSVADHRSLMALVPFPSCRAPIRVPGDRLCSPRAWAEWAEWAVASGALLGRAD
jgi:hypothetical protein